MIQFTQQLKLKGYHWITLSFPEALEELYQKKQFAKSIQRHRIVLLLGIILYSLFAILDFYVFPEVIRQLFFIRFGIVVPIGVALLLFTWSNASVKRHQ